MWREGSTSQWDSLIEARVRTLQDPKRIGGFATTVTNFVVRVGIFGRDSHTQRPPASLSKEPAMLLAELKWPDVRDLDRSIPIVIPVAAM